MEKGKQTYSQAWCSEMKLLGFSTRKFVRPTGTLVEYGIKNMKVRKKWVENAQFPSFSSNFSIKLAAKLHLVAIRSSYAFWACCLCNSLQVQ
jgi:hypothetical protein